MLLLALVEKIVLLFNLLTFLNNTAIKRCPGIFFFNRGTSCPKDPKTTPWEKKVKKINKNESVIFLRKKNVKSCIFMDKSRKSLQ